jgi:hypothetical protein
VQSVPQPSPYGINTDTEKFKIYELPGTDHILAELIHLLILHYRTEYAKQTKKQTPSFSPQANYTNQSTTAASEVVLTFAGRECCMVSATDSHDH